jgi:GNAT superfamily N-acetyltransferase
MSANHQFAAYTPAQREICLALFDTNCPEFFAPNERADYAKFLDNIGDEYLLCVLYDEIVGAFGLVNGSGVEDAHLNWIMVDPASQGSGIGRAIMMETRRIAQGRGRSVVHIAASHRSAPFFSRFGANQVTYTVDGWGPDMHRIDMEWSL